MPPRPGRWWWAGVELGGRLAGVRRRSGLGALALVVAAIGVGRALRGVALDDPYVTYRYAENLLGGLGPVYNPGERVLSTTAFGYAVVLAAVHAVSAGLAMPASSNAISAFGLGVLALSLYGLCAGHGRAAA